jgi:lysophospholipase L1-like esterase
VAVLNRGIVSDTTGVFGDRGILNRLDESVFACRPRIVFVQIGGNDLSSSNRAPEVFVQGVVKIVDAISAKLPKVPIVLHALMPKGRKYARVEEMNPRILAFNEGVRALARERKLALIDLHAAYAGPDGYLPDDLSNDGVHLKRDAYARWAELIRPFLK